MFVFRLDLIRAKRENGAPDVPSDRVPVPIPEKLVNPSIPKDKKVMVDIRKIFLTFKPAQRENFLIDKRFSYEIS